MNKRSFLQIGGAFVGAIALLRFLPFFKGGSEGSEAIAGPEGQLASNKSFEITKTKEEWSEVLSPAAFHVLREEGTERPFSSPLNKVYDAGTYSCAGCGLPVYSSEAKFDSGTGWPSFYAAISDSVIETSVDNSFFMRRTEVHCARCGGHFGHIFNDGPEPTGERHCLNGVALEFTPEAAS